MIAIREDDSTSTGCGKMWSLSSSSFFFCFVFLTSGSSGNTFVFILNFKLIVFFYLLLAFSSISTCVATTSACDKGWSTVSCVGDRDDPRTWLCSPEHSGTVGAFHYATIDETIPTGLTIYCTIIR